DVIVVAMHLALQDVAEELEIYDWWRADGWDNRRRANKWVLNPLVAARLAIGRRKRRRTSPCKRRQKNEERPSSSFASSCFAATVHGSRSPRCGSPPRG